MRNAFRAALLSAALIVPSVAAADMTIAATAQQTDDLSTLVTALDAAGLVATVDGEGPFTVFAPTNEAFEALPDGALDGLLADTDALSGVLTYHVVPAEVMAADLLAAIEAGGGEHTVETVAGGTLTASVVDGTVVLTDAQGGTANVIATDVDASNGVVHLIDSVLMP